MKAKYDYHPHGLLWGKVEPSYKETLLTAEFNFSEWGEDGGLDMNFSEARFYDPLLIRWHAPVQQFLTEAQRRFRNASSDAIGDPLEQFHSPYLAMCDDPANFVDPDGKAGMPLLQDFMDSDLGMFCQWSVSTAAIVGGASALGSLGGTIGSVVSGDLQLSSAASSVAGIASNGSAVAYGGSFAASSSFTSDIYMPGRYGMSYNGAGSDGGQKDPPKKSEPTIYEKTKEIQQYLPSSVNFGLGVLAFGESIVNYFSEYSIGTYKQELFENIMNDLTFGTYSSVQIANSIRGLGLRVVNGEFSAGNIEFGLGYVAAPVGLTVLTEGAISRLSFRIGVQYPAAKGGGNAFRYMTKGELKAIQDTGLLRGGRAGETCFTKDLYKSVASAQNRLALPTSPTLRVEFQILNNPTLLRNGTKVLPAHGMMGKGAEFMTLDPVRVELINWQPLR